MFQTLRLLAAALLAVWLAIPGRGGDGDGGENAGGTGVWILPRCETVTSNSANIFGTSQPRVSPFAFSSLAQDLRMKVSNECGAATAVLFDGLTGSATDLPVLGQTVFVPATLLQSLYSARVADSEIFVVDAAHKGYLIKLRLDLVTARGEILVY